MNILKNILLILIKSCVFICLGLLIFSSVFMLTIGNPSFTKKTLASSGIYSNISDGVKQQIRTQITSPSTGSGAGNNTIMNEAINQTIKPETIQQSIEENITHIYDWLNGTTANLEVGFDTNKLQSNLIQAIISGVRTRTSSLPTCTKTLRPTTNDIFTINCIPPGTNIDAESVKLEQQIKQQTSTQAKDINLNKNISDNPQISNIPPIFKFIKLLPLILPISILFLVAITIFIVRPRYKAWQYFASLFLTYAIICIFIRIFLYHILLNKITHSYTKTDLADLSLPAQKIAELITRQMNSIIMVFGLVFLVIGVFSLIVYILISKKKKMQFDTHQQNSTSQT